MIRKSGLLKEKKISSLIKGDLDIIAKKKNYIDYLANRPRVERIGTHGLFSNLAESNFQNKQSMVQYPSEKV